MFSSPINRAARQARAAKLASSGSSDKPSCCPRRKLTLQISLLAIMVLISPFFSAGAPIASAEFDTGEMALAIDSPIFTLDMVSSVTEDGFLLKSAGQTASVDRSELADITTYVVEQGDSLSTIARQFGVSTDTIIWENNITNPHSLKLGTELAILPVSGISHTTAAGDTIASVAKKYGVTTEKLAKQNQLGTDAVLTAGAKIVIPGGRRAISTSNTYVASTSTGTYAAYRAPTSIDGTVIVQNGAKDKTGKWMVKPTAGIYTTYFGGRSGHWAVDIADRSQPAIRAAANGTVVKSQCGWNGGYGCMAVIDHGDGFQTLYGHMSRLDVAVGEKVTQGQTIGQMGATGRVYGATGIHLHFEVIDNGKKKNPLAFYSE
jgi:murein DD-endopeptidase MepM/ murein hydrolase activator NlpD